MDTQKQLNVPLHRRLLLQRALRRRRLFLRLFSRGRLRLVLLLFFRRRLLLVGSRRAGRGVGRFFLPVKSGGAFCVEIRFTAENPHRAFYC